MSTTWPKRLERFSRELSQVAIQCGSTVAFELLPDWLLVRVKDGATIWVSREDFDVHIGDTVCVVAQRKVTVHRWNRAELKDLRTLVRTSLALAGGAA